LKKNWVKLNLFYIGKSKKHQIFRVRQWKKNLEKIFKRPIYDENYDLVGVVKDIFGPINLPFISIKTSQDHHFDPNTKFYSKLN
jgi:rRNA processing protein Gar1